MIWSSRERNRSCSLVSRRSRGRIANPPLHQLEREESRLAIRRNPQNRICKEVALQRPKTGKFDYLSAPNHPAHSMAFKFFTDDELENKISGNRRLKAPSALAYFTGCSCASPDFAARARENGRHSEKEPHGPCRGED